jgi:hypothetical protein
LCACSGSKQSQASDEVEDAPEVGRRRFVSESLAGALSLSAAAGAFSSLLFPISSAVASSPSVGGDAAGSPNSDILDRFGIDLSSQQQRSSKWPRDSPSPLPTTKRSAQELTQDYGAGSGAAGEEEGSDAQRAVRDALQRKQIDPRTHG